MIRKIIRIDESKCSGCGACAAACHEGAIQMVDGVARLTREDYCDGLGDCLPACPTGAISFEEREAPAYDEAAVKAAQAAQSGGELPCGCPGSAAKSLERRSGPGPVQPEPERESQLSQWPVQIKLVPVQAPYFQGTAPPTPTRASMSGSSGTTSPWWAAPSWTAWITVRSSRRFSGTTT